MSGEAARVTPGPATSSPCIFVIAGPNGAGKSTTAPTLLRKRFNMSTYVNADLIAAGLSSFQPEAAAFQAGRIMLAQMNALVRKRATFAFETTLATRGYARWLRGCRVQGYRVGLLFLSLPDSEAGVERVSRSVQSGGHAILEDVVRRRFSRGLHNFYNLYLPLLDRWFFADNLGSTPRPLPHGGLGLSTVEQDPLFEELRNRYGAV